MGLANNAEKPSKVTENCDFWPHDILQAVFLEEDMNSDANQGKETKNKVK